MPRIQTSCPQCKQPIVAEIFQVVDVARTPELKELLLAGGLNIARCPLCGFQGQIPVPVVYHDAGKELLLTFSPPDMTKTMEEKESALAPLLKNIIDNLKPEERKGYLFQPQAMLTMNNLVKNILLGDGITEEMIQDQQEKMRLLDQLFTKEGEKLREAVRENNPAIDREFFSLFAEIAQRIISTQDEKAIKKVQEIQDALMAESDLGKEILRESEEIQAARKALEALGENLTRDSLLDLIVTAPSQERVKAFAGLVRPALDYEFFQKFTDRIESTGNDQRNQLVEKRNLLLKLTQEIDNKLAERIDRARKLIESIITSEDPETALLDHLYEVDQFFIQALSSELELAENNQEDQKRASLEALLNHIQELTSPPELKFMEKLVSLAEDEEMLKRALEEDESQVNPQLIDYMTSIIGQYSEQVKSRDTKDRQELESQLEKLQLIYNAVLKKSMKMKLSEK